MHRKSTIAALPCLLGLAVAAPVWGYEFASDLVTRLATTDSRRHAQVSEFWSVRHYVLHNPRWKTDATMDVRMHTLPSGKKKYDILSTSAEGIQKQILLRILEGEVESAERNDKDSSINPQNYEMKPIGYESINGRPCQAVELIPRQRSKFTFDGRACIDLEDAAVVRLEGRTAKNISFWVGRPYVVQEFCKVGNFWMSASNQSTADVKFFGTTQLYIKYSDYSIVPKSGVTLIACGGPSSCSPRQ